ncbi:hypothetical protein Glove_212g204 [Diversispora epigaea]|uniref:Uncharacterized protein n=1 Tax=Diversispora epigaea TaxID=1348612 RepID=A0A397II28_9GLOM|nr:hypothetical protein Glove_212g204 [Diversispora epigaea]
MAPGIKVEKYCLDYYENDFDNNNEIIIQIKETENFPKIQQQLQLQQIINHIRKQFIPVDFSIFQIFQNLKLEELTKSVYQINSRSRVKKEDEGYIFIGAKVLELNKKNEIDINLYLRRVDEGEIVIVKEQTKNRVLDSDREMESDLMGKLTEFITLIFMHSLTKGTYRVRISTMVEHAKSLRHERFEEYKTASEQYSLSHDDYTAFEEAINSLDIPIWYENKIVINDKGKNNNIQHNPESDPQREISTTSQLEVNSVTNQMGGNRSIMVEEVPNKSRECTSEVTLPKNVEEFGRLMQGIEEHTINTLSIMVLIGNGELESNSRDGA